MGGMGHWGVFARGAPTGHLVAPEGRSETWLRADENPGSKVGGNYRASAGAVYPTLQQLEDEGLVTSVQQEGKRVYQITEATAGRNWRRTRQASSEMWERAGGWGWGDWNAFMGPHIAGVGAGHARHEVSCPRRLTLRQQSGPDGKGLRGLDHARRDLDTITSLIF